MAIKSQGRSINIRPIGARLPRARAPLGDQSVNPLFGIASLAKDIGDDETRIEAADSAAQHEFQVDPVTNLPVLPEQKSSFTIFGKHYNKEIRKNYLLRLDTDVETKLNEIANENYLSPTAYAEVARSYLDEVSKSVDPIARPYITAKGAARLGGHLSAIRTRFAQKGIAEAKGRREDVIQEISTSLNNREIGEDTDGKARELVDHFINNNPAASQFFSSELSRESLTKEIIVAHAHNSYWIRFKQLPHAEQVDALESFAKTGEYIKDGEVILKRYGGMTDKGMRTAHTLLEAVHIDAMHIRNQRRDASADAVSALVFQDLVASTDLDLNNPTLQAINNLDDPKQKIGLFHRLRAIAQDKITDKQNSEFARDMLPFAIGALKDAGLSSFVITQEQLQEIGDGNAMLTEVMHLLRISKFGEAEKRKLQIKKNNEHSVNYSQNLIDITQAKLDSMGIVFDFEEELRAQLYNIPEDDPEAYVRLRLQATYRLMSESADLIRVKNNRDIKFVNQQKFLENVVELNGLSENAEGLQRLLERLRKDDVDPSVAGRLITQQISTLLSDKKRKGIEAQKILPIVRNIQRTSNGLPARHITSTPELRRKNAFVLQAGSAYSGHIDAGGSPAGAYLGDIAFDHFMATGILPQPIISHLTEATNKRDTARTAVSVYMRYKNIPGWLSTRLRDHLDKNTVSKLEYLADAGVNDDNFTETQRPDFNGSLEKNLLSVWGDLTPQKRSELETKVFKAAIEDMNTHPSEGGNRLGNYLAMMPHNFAGADFHELSKMRGGPNNTINFSTLPAKFKADVIEYAQHTLARLVKTPGDEGEIKNIIKQGIDTVLGRGEYGISKYASSNPLPGGSLVEGSLFGKGKVPGKWHVAYKPPEMYAIDDNGKITWFDEYVMKDINARILRVPGMEKERFINRDIRLVPMTDKANQKGVPQYRVQIVGEDSREIHTAFEEFEITEIDEDEKVIGVSMGVRSLDIEIGPALEHQNNLVNQQRDFETKQNLLGLTLDYDQRASATQPKKGAYAPAEESKQVINTALGDAAFGGDAGVPSIIAKGVDATLGWIRGQVDAGHSRVAARYSAGSDLSGPLLPPSKDADKEVSKEKQKAAISKAPAPPSTLATHQQNFALEDLVARTLLFEGTKFTAYKDTAIPPVVTIGTGLAISSGHTRTLKVLKKHKIAELMEEDASLTESEAKKLTNTWIHKLRLDANLPPHARAHTISAAVNKKTYTELLEQNLAWVEEHYKGLDLNYLQKSVIADLRNQAGNSWVGKGTSFYRAVHAGDWDEAIYQIEYESNPDYYKDPRPDGADGIQRRHIERVKSLDIGRGGRGRYRGPGRRGINKRSFDHRPLQ